MKKIINKRRRLSRDLEKSGSSLVEAVVGIVFLITVGLAAMDIGVVVLGGDQAGSLAKQAAHAAGNAADKKEADAAVADVAAHFTPNNMYKSVSVVMDKYDNTYNGNVHINCSMTLNLPVAIPLLNVGPSFVIKTQATAPIIGINPPAPS